MTIKLDMNLAHIRILTNKKKSFRYIFKMAAIMAAIMAANSLKITFWVKNGLNLTIFSGDTENGQLDDI